MLTSLLVAASILGVSTGFQPSVSHQLVSPDTGQVKLSIGTLSEPLAGELSAAAWAWALGQRAALGLPANSSLRNVQTHGTRFGAAVRLQQQIDGVDVYGAQVVVTINAQRRVTMVSSSVLPFERSVMGWAIDSDEALARAAKAIPMALLQNSGKPYGGVRREVFPLGVEAHAGYLTMVPTLNQTENWYVAIDATTGEVLWKQNRVLHAANDARAYATSPGGLDAGVGVQSTIDVSLTHADGGSMVLADAGGYLSGDQLTAYNCCPNKDCSTLPDAGPRRVQGQMVLMGFNVTYDVPLCERLQRANNDVLIHDAGSYVYPPIDPPTVTAGVVGPVLQSDLSHSDEFAEVHAFFHVNQVYDWVRLLSSTAAPLFPTNVPAITGFKMRDELRVPARKPAILTNVVFPDIGEITSNPAGKCTFTQPVKCTIDKLARQDNAAFMPKENFAQIPLPELAMDVDTLMIFQGNYSDFAYDAPVLWHEFGHGVVYATAALGFDQLAVDTRSANNETGAMHEGFADFLAGAFGNVAEIGTYVGPRIGGGQTLAGVRQDSFLRSLNNTFTCPDVLWGEVHQDSQHYSAALWQARNSFFLGTDNGRTFDAAFYASLVSMSPQVNFTDAAAIIVAHVKTAFPGIADAETKMQTMFTQKGVVACSKILDMTGITTGRPYYGITAGGPAGFPATTVIPGPYQMKVKTPAGMKSLTLTAVAGGGGNPLGGGAPKPKLLVKVGQPITFAKVGAQLNNNADLLVDGVIAGSNVTATASLFAPCGATSEVYFTIGSTQAETLQNVKVSFLAADSCTAPDAGTDGGAGGGAGDGGTGGGAGGGSGGAGGGDGGSEVKQVPWIGGMQTGPGAPKGCGCSGVEAGLGGFAALLLLMRRRRKS
ncbi:MAG: putative Bacterial Ig-like domain [Myxococcaceae bacterium]|nr:putative Bacterial Ig-like domain [Myxococcaceae bacterium]